MSTAPLSRIALYYRFTPLADPEAVRLWQRALAASLGLTGRIIVSPQGINGTVGGPVDAVKRYVRGTREHPAFRDLEVKWSDGSAADFPRLSVKVKPELVAFGAPERVTVDADGVVGREAAGRVREDRVATHVEHVEQALALRVDQPLAADGHGHDAAAAGV